MTPEKEEELWVTKVEEEAWFSLYFVKKTEKKEAGSFREEKGKYLVFKQKWKENKKNKHLKYAAQNFCETLNSLVHKIDHQLKNFTYTFQLRF